ncbi:hypothetical protein N9W89_11625 [Hellea sp.]|nr:hypothetical protein [Hellea sp.]
MKKAILTPLIIAVTFAAAPAFGQTSYENCKTNDTQNQVLGAVIGGTLGAVLGNEVSGDTGAVVGGLAGGTAGVAVADKDCSQYRSRGYEESRNYDDSYYNDRRERTRHHNGRNVTTHETISYDQYGNRVVTKTKVHEGHNRRHNNRNGY